MSAINYGFSFTNALLTIVKAMVTVAANPVSANYGGPIPALTYSINGLVNGDLATVVSGTPALATTATSSSAVGQYAITAGLGALSAANYNFSFTGSQVAIRQGDAHRYGEPRVLHLRSGDSSVDLHHRRLRRWRRGDGGLRRAGSHQFGDCVIEAGEGNTPSQ